jgi:hypothetical protein
MNDDAGFAVFYAACAAALATDIIVDLYTFFRPPAPYHHLFVLDLACQPAKDVGDTCSQQT